MTVESFMKMLKPRLEARTPFLAYWHENGFMVLNTGVIEWDEYTLKVGTERKGFRSCTAISKDQLEAIQHYAIKNRDDVEIVRKKKRHKTVKSSAISKMRKIIDQLHKDPRIGPVYTVEFDGRVLVKTAPDSSILASLNVPEMAQN